MIWVTTQNHMAHGIDQGEMLSDLEAVDHLPPLLPSLTLLTPLPSALCFRTYLEVLGQLHDDLGVRLLGVLVLGNCASVRQWNVVCIC